jgi:glycosyltransferase involved in cell wall biosynthesis
VWPILLSDPAIENLPAPLRRPNVVACVGRLNRTKGQDVLIRALPTLIEQLPQIEVEFIGEGPERDRYQALADELEVGANCRFIGLKPHDEVMHHMATSMLVVVPSRIDALGLVNIEALAVGTPVVGSSVGGIVEVISDQVNGYLVPPDDPIDLSEKILELLKNPRKWHQFSQEARQTFLTHFELRNNVIGQANWYENLVTTASN